MRVVHLTSAHTADDIRIYHREVKSLANSGFDVSIIAPGDENDLSIKKIKVPVFFFKKSSNRAERFFLGSLRLLRLVLSIKADIYHFHDPDLIPIGVILKLLGKRVIYDVHENYPKDILTKHWIARPLRGFVSRFVNLIEVLSSKLFDAIIAATPAIAKRFPAPKTLIIQNFPILDEAAFIQPSTSYIDRSDQVIYVGSISEVRGIKEMVKAIEILNNSLSEENFVKLLLLGKFESERLFDEVSSLPGWKYVEFLGWKSRDVVEQFLLNSKLGLVIFHPAPNYIDSQPNKLFEYMAAGLPVVASDFPLWREIIKAINAGLLVDPLSPVEIAEAMKRILTNPQAAELMGKSGKRAVLEKYNWSAEEEKLLALYGRLTR